MQQSTATEPSPPSPSFAALMAALAGSRSHGDSSSPPRSNSATAWNDDNLADDIATLSYESALRAHARYRSPAPSHLDQSLTQAVDPKPTRIQEISKTGFAVDTQPAPPKGANPEQDASRLQTAQHERNLKGASITIRVSKAECAQLRQRAAEAGLTVSAYLRSCTVEAESLRAMVKNTLTQLRAATSQPKPAAAPSRSAWPGRVAGWLTPRRSGQRAARV